MNVLAEDRVRPSRQPGRGRQAIRESIAAFEELGDRQGRAA